MSDDDDDYGDKPFFSRRFKILWAIGVLVVMLPPLILAILYKRADNMPAPVLEYVNFMWAGPGLWGLLIAVWSMLIIAFVVKYVYRRKL